MYICLAYSQTNKIILTKRKLNYQSSENLFLFSRTVYAHREMDEYESYLYVKC